jgi:hypothetical protein
MWLTGWPAANVRDLLLSVKIRNSVRTQKATIWYRLCHMAAWNEASETNRKCVVYLNYFAKQIRAIRRQTVNEPESRWVKSSKLFLMLKWGKLRIVNYLISYRCRFSDVLAHSSPVKNGVSLYDSLCFLLLVVYHVTKVYLRSVNTTVGYKPILKCLTLELFYFHPAACFDLWRWSSGGFYELRMSLLNY